MHTFSCVSSCLFSFVDCEVDAVAFCESRRDILPVVYSISKQRQAIQSAANISYLKRSHEREINEIEADGGDDKRRVRDEIAQKLAMMDNLLIELDDDEVEEFQDLLANDIDVDDGHANGGDDLFNGMGNIATTNELNLGQGAASSASSAENNAPSPNNGTTIAGQSKPQPQSETEVRLVPVDAKQREINPQLVSAMEKVNDMLEKMPLHVPARYAGDAYFVSKETLVFETNNFNFKIVCLVLLNRKKNALFFQLRMFALSTR